MPDQSLKQEIEKCLREAFPEKSRRVVCMANIHTGANVEAHFAVCTTDGIFSVRRWPAATLHGRSEARHAFQDELMYRFASSVDAPNVCPSKYTNKLNYEPFAGFTVALVRWLPNSIAFQDMTNSDFCSILKDGTEFFRQFGEWLVFTLVTGAQDSTESNFVWSEEHKNLARIDMDWSFEGPGFQRDPLTIIRLLLKAEHSQNLTPYYEAAKIGVHAMRLKIAEKTAWMRDELKQAPFPEPRNFSDKVKLNDELVEEYMNELKKLLG